MQRDGDPTHDWGETAGDGAGPPDADGEPPKKHDGDVAAFEIKDWSLEVTNKTTIGSATGGAGGGKAEFAEFSIHKLKDDAEPQFFKDPAREVNLGERDTHGEELEPIETRDRASDKFSPYNRQGKRLKTNEAEERGKGGGGDGSGDNLDNGRDP